MSENGKDLKKIARQFFAAYTAHDADAMTALCAPDARGWYVPYGRGSEAPVRGGIDAIWRAFPQAVPDFHVDIVSMMLAEDDTVVTEGLLGGTMPAADPLGMASKGDIVLVPHVFILRFDADARIRQANVYWDNAVLLGIKASAL